MYDFVRVRVRSQVECAIICERVQTCVIAKYGGEDSDCELMSVEDGMSHFSQYLTGKWQTLGR